MEGNISKLINVFNTDNNIYRWMKLFYSDIRSNGDIVINMILDKLNNKIIIFTEEEHMFIDHIYSTYIDYYKDKMSNPNDWWIVNQDHRS